MIALLWLPVAGAHAASGDVDTCKRDLFQTDGALRATRDRLGKVASGSPAEKCAEWRRHVTVLRRASGVFARCTSGRERAENVGQMDGSVADFTDVIRSRCGGL